MMDMIPVICTIIGGCLLLIACGSIMYSASRSNEGEWAVFVIILFFIVAYIIITCMVAVARYYYDLPPLPWEFI